MMSGRARGSPPKPVPIWKSYTDTRRTTCAYRFVMGGNCVLERLGQFKWGGTREVASPEGSAPMNDSSTALFGEGLRSRLRPSRTVHLLLLAHIPPFRDRPLGRYPVCFVPGVRAHNCHSRRNGMHTYLTNRFIIKM